jgi:hypothetical protein
MKRISIFALILFACFVSTAWEQQQKAGKPLAGYTAIRVEPFTVENSPLTIDFPAGEEANLQLSAIARLRASGIFETVIDASQKSSDQPPPSRAFRKRRAAHANPLRHNRRLQQREQRRTLYDLAFAGRG